MKQNCIDQSHLNFQLKPIFRAISALDPLENNILPKVLSENELFLDNYWMTNFVLFITTTFDR